MVLASCELLFGYLLDGERMQYVRVHAYSARVRYFAVGAVGVQGEQDYSSRGARRFLISDHPTLRGKMWERRAKKVTYPATR